MERREQNVIRRLTVGDALQLAQRDINTVDARVLLQHALRTNRAHLAAHPERVLSEAERDRFCAVIDRRKNGEPVAYIVGEREFFGLSFRVTTAVLIPRPETELLVEQALARLPGHRSTRILDLGTGSGAIAIAIAQQRPCARAVAVDFDADALEIATYNGRHLLGEQASSVEFQLSNWFSAVAEKLFDMIVSNPPYVANDDPHLAQGDLRFEPRRALDGGAGGLSALEHITRNAAPRLGPCGWLLLEHGYDQSEACSKLMYSAGFVGVETHRDLAGIDRVTIGQRPM
ncbi:MAG: peptide chain release factor N(5)-glutamine methyltransferase [Burkholderiales bacterium]